MDVKDVKRLLKLSRRAKIKANNASREVTLRRDERHAPTHRRPDFPRARITSRSLGTLSRHPLSALGSTPSRSLHPGRR